MNVLRVLEEKPPFKYLEKNERHAIARTFRKHAYPKGSFLVEQGKSVDQVGLIDSGLADMVVTDPIGSCIQCGVLKKGDFFGFISIFRNVPAMFNITCRQPVDCYVQSSHDFFEMIDTYTNVRNFFYRTALNSTIYTLQKINRSDASISKDKTDITQPSKTIERALQYIDKNYTQPITLAEVAQKSGISKYHFCRVFKAKTGNSFTEYLNKKRIEAAQHLLTDQKLNVSETCFSVGFNDLSYFARVFKERVGVNPSHFKSRKNGTC